ncbi:MFS transporter [Streptomyces roseifaciens]
MKGLSVAIAAAVDALVMPATMSLLLYVTEPRRRGGAVASWSAAVAMGGILGNTGGALVLQYLPWQGLFWAYVPLGGALLAWTARVAPRPPRGGAALDVPGSALLMAGLRCCTGSSRARRTAGPRRSSWAPSPWRPWCSRPSPGTGCARRTPCSIRGCSGCPR